MSSRVMVLYDGACRFCRCCVAVLLRWDRRHRLYPVEIQSTGGQILLLSTEPYERLRSAHIVTADGKILSGAPAAPMLFRVLPLGKPIATAVDALMPLTELAYRVVTRLRGVAGPMIPDRWCSSADRLIADRRRGITPPTIAR